MKDCAEQHDENPRKGPGHDSVESSYNVDVCVVGGGGRASAAISAVQAGANVVGCRKCGITGGSTNVSEGRSTQSIRNVSNRESKTLVEQRSTKSPMKEDTKGTPELIHYPTDNALDLVHWLESLGVKFKGRNRIGHRIAGRAKPLSSHAVGNTYIRAFEAFAADHADQLVVCTRLAEKSLIQKTAPSLV